MKVVIFCGGKGTRLREETEFKPKPMVEVGGRPILWHIMQRYAGFGHKHFILPLGYRGQDIKKYFHDFKISNSDFSIDLGTGKMRMHSTGPCVDWQVTLCDTGEDTQKGARLKRVAAHLGNERFMATYGDGVADIDLDRLLRFHLAHGKLATFTGVRMPSRFGTVSMNEDGGISRWQEKPILNEFTNCGFFVFEPQVLDYLAEDETCDLEKEPMERLVREGQLAMYRHEGFWQCMDTLRDHHTLNDLWDSGAVPWLR